MSTTPKLRVPYKGPVLLLRQITPLNYAIQLDVGGTKRLIRHDKLKPYKGTGRLSWAKALAKAVGRGHCHPEGRKSRLEGNGVDS